MKYRFLFGGSEGGWRPPRTDKSIIYKDNYTTEGDLLETNMLEIDLSKVQNILEYDLGEIVPEQSINEEYVKTVTDAVVKSIFRMKQYHNK